jgi:hypothetical protein
MIAVARSKIKNVADDSVREDSVPNTSDQSPQGVESPKKRTAHVQDKDNSNAFEQQIKADVVNVLPLQQPRTPEINRNDAVYGDGFDGSALPRETEDRSSSRGASPLPQSRQDYF